MALLYSNNLLQTVCTHNSLSNDHLFDPNKKSNSKTEIKVKTENKQTMKTIELYQDIDDETQNDIFIDKLLNVERRDW